MKEKMACLVANLCIVFYGFVLKKCAGKTIAGGSIQKMTGRVYATMAAAKSLSKDVLESPV